MPPTSDNPVPSETAPSDRLPQEDVALMARVVTGDEAAFVQIYRKFAPGLFSMIYEIVRDQSEAEDVLQEAFVQIWNKADSFDASRSAVFTWAVMIARHKAIDHLRRSGRHYRNIEAVADASQEAAHVSTSPTGSDAASSTDDRNRVSAALERLPAEQREAIRLAFFGGLSHADVAQRLAAPLGTVKARIRRGMQALQTLLTQQ